MKNRKMIGIAATLVLSLGVLAACGDNDDYRSSDNKDAKQSSSSKSSSTQQNDLNGKTFNLSMEDVINKFQEKNKNADLTSVKLEYEHGKVVYKVEGMDDTNEYEMVFDADSEEVLQDSSEALDMDDKNERANEKIDVTNVISMDEAMQKAVAEVDGAVESVELDRSYNDTVYDVSIQNGANESEVRLSAQDGSIINVEND
ncbi:MULTISPECIES: PepSY domain-containing protein [Listeria]|uniref:PepSY domain-containing protein n=1 Tax=Listeria TaxID=1637 RepID=UPI000B58B7E4|nr:MULTISPECIES: PepSY domain-containing protein [Listeria]